jgi:2'-5' RNA ligase
VSADTILIGVALAIPDPWGAEIEGWRESLGDPQALSIPAHITLLPPTRVPVSALPTIRDHLVKSASAIEPFEIRLRGTGTFRPVSPVVFVSVAQGISGCEQLEAHIRCGVLERELDYPYHPHVTVAHDVPDEVLDRAFASLAGFSAEFIADEFALYVHDESGVWQVHERFALNLGQKPA